MFAVDILDVTHRISPATFWHWESDLGFLTLPLTLGMFLEIPRSTLPREQKTDNLTRFTWLAFYVVLFCYSVLSVAMTMLAACVIAAEIFRYVLSARHNLEKFFRFLRVAIAGTIFWAAVETMGLPEFVPHNNKPTWLARLTLTRNFDAIEAIFILAILAMLFYYRIPLGKNLKGMFLGSGLFLGTTVALYSVRLYAGHPLFQRWMEWTYLTNITYDICMVIWLVSFWNYHPNPPSPVLAEIQAASEPQGNYEGITAHALRVVFGPRGYAGRAFARAWASLSPAKSPLS